MSVSAISCSVARDAVIMALRIVFFFAGVDLAPFGGDLNSLAVKLRSLSMLREAWRCGGCVALIRLKCACCWTAAVHTALLTTLSPKSKMSGEIPSLFLTRSSSRLFEYATVSICAHGADTGPVSDPAV